MSEGCQTLTEKEKQSPSPDGARARRRNPWPATSACRSTRSTNACARRGGDCRSRAAGRRHGCCSKAGRDPLFPRGQVFRGSRSAGGSGRRMRRQSIDKGGNEVRAGSSRELSSCRSFSQSRRSILQLQVRADVRCPYVRVGHASRGRPHGTGLARPRRCGFGGRKSWRGTADSFRAQNTVEGTDARAAEQARVPLGQWSRAPASRRRASPLRPTALEMVKISCQLRQLRGRDEDADPGPRGTGMARR